VWSLGWIKDGCSFGRFLDFGNLWRWPTNGIYGRGWLSLARRWYQCFVDLDLGLFGNDTLALSKKVRECFLF
jgi:hypothetical protein